MKEKHRQYSPMDTMAACILIAQGLSSAEAMQLVKDRRPKADPYVFYIRKRIEKFEEVWRDTHSKPDSDAL